VKREVGLVKIYDLFIRLLLLANLLFWLPGYGVMAQEAELRFMGVDEIRPGMKGYGKTVFKDNKIERFDVEILGVLRNVSPKGDMILARLAGGPLRDMGVIAGMSGSPVFIDDRLIGAVAYGWGFSKEPITGITPIEEMLQVYELTSSEPSAPDEVNGGTQRLFPSPTEQSVLAPYRIQIERDKLKQLDLPIPSEFTDSLTLEPLATPLFITSCHPVVLRELKRLFAPYNMTAVLSGSASGSASAHGDIPIEPGAALGVQLVAGDLDISAVGTVTYCKGNKLVAFGHPMFLSGNVDIPMTSAYIYSILPSYYFPFKFGEVVKQVGSVRQDRMTAIGGVLGREAPMVPISVSVRLPDQQQTRTFSYRVWEDREFGPRLTAISLYESLLSTDKFQGDSAATIHYTITLDDGRTITKSDFISSDFGVAISASMPVAFDIRTLVSNPFKAVRIKQITFEAELIDKLLTARLVATHTNKTTYKPGETVEITLYIQPWRKQIEPLKASFTIPADLPDGNYFLSISDGRGRQELEYTRAPGMFQPLSFDQLLRTLKQNFPQNYMYLTVQKDTGGLTVHGKELAALPPSVMRVIADASVAQFTQPTRGIFLWDHRIKTQYAVSGADRIVLEVRRHE